MCLSTTCCFCFSLEIGCYILAVISFNWNILLLGMAAWELNAFALVEGLLSLIADIVMVVIVKFRHPEMNLIWLVCKLCLLMLHAILLAFAVMEVKKAYYISIRPQHISSAVELGLLSGMIILSCYYMYVSMSFYHVVKEEVLLVMRSKRVRRASLESEIVMEETPGKRPAPTEAPELAHKAKYFGNPYMRPEVRERPARGRPRLRGRRPMRGRPGSAKSSAQASVKTRPNQRQSRRRGPNVDRGRRPNVDRGRGPNVDRGGGG
ncbi:unnamed protein product [Sphagnum tenellum]